MNDISSCYEYIQALKERDCLKTVEGLLKTVSYVYLTRRQRLRLCLMILGTILRGI